MAATTRAKAMAELTSIIQKWFEEDEAETDFAEVCYITPNTAGLMATAAFTVLDACSAHEQYLKEEGYTK